MIWAIYVSDKPHSRVNFPIGMSNGIWGVHESKKKTIKRIEANDYVVFVYSISWLKAEGTPPKGFSRVGKDKLDLFRGSVQKIIFGKVTRAYYQDEKEVWPDDTYPHRFNFEILERHDNGVMFGTEFYHSSFVEAVRYSACTQGSITEVNDIKNLTQLKGVSSENVGDYGVDEGKPIYRVHKTRERDPKLTKDKKQQVLSITGKLCCEICNFDFYECYGDLGLGFAECHHLEPLALRESNKKTKLDDLAILCANCHRMIHYPTQWLSVEELKEKYERQRNKSIDKSTERV
ncbi:restriction endonuclease-like protein [Shewanella halifaxensis HAW-EB4]|uniref:Restriction endonuclease-like protein n=1 Tax=Shewanella halifaxensis (strain HAW-EB4) TaxID=458817 RepID=B0TQV8_SHEHH|nr:HNH endonuclease [Shewanella halifaxensis]ABZ76353.1 restriction endonuclease-like protein [Shewanella halifaxensis HAW-EB4]